MVFPLLELVERSTGIYLNLMWNVLWGMADPPSTDRVGDIGSIVFAPELL